MIKLNAPIHTLLAVSIVLPVQAGGLSVPNGFSANTPAIAAEVNANFDAVKTAVDDNDARIAVIESTLATLQATVISQADTITLLQDTIDSQAATIAIQQSTIDEQAGTIADLQGKDIIHDLDIVSLLDALSTVQQNKVLALEPYLSVDTVSDPRGPMVRLSGVNLQLVNGTGRTDASANGLGNLIIGYDLARSDTTFFCSFGYYTDQINCENAGGTWAVSHKSGSHYLVIGDRNNYSQYGGIVVGTYNTGNREGASVTGGYNNVASGLRSSVSGGFVNTASGTYSSVSGGLGNTASGQYGSVCGGNSSIASGDYSSISGGSNNKAAWGGSSVSGGKNNIANGTYSSVSGGLDRSATDIYSWAAGGLLETN